MVSNDTFQSVVGSGTAHTRIKVAVVINFLTSYRESFYERLLHADGIDLTIYCHRPPARLNLTSIHSKFPEHVQLLEGKFIFGEKIVLSSIPWKELLTQFDTVFIEGNPRYISMALLATRLQIAGRRVVLWTMVHSFRPSRLGLILRMAWNKFFDRLLVYSDTEAQFLKDRGFRGHIVSINNGVDIDQINQSIEPWHPAALRQWQKENDLTGKIVLLSCARLEKKNKFEQVIAALEQVVRHVPTAVWCVIGGGAEQAALEDLTQRSGLQSHVRFLGPIYDENFQAPWFLSARVLIHSGAIGLTLLHAMGYGVPVITHDAASHHGPEFAAFVNGQHGASYPEDSIEALGNTISSLLADPARCALLGAAGKRVVVDRYNTNVMVERFLSMADRNTSISGKPSPRTPTQTQDEPNG